MILLEPISEEHYRQVSAEERSTSWGDTARQLGAGILDATTGTVGAATSYVTRGAVGDDLRQWSDEQSKSLRDNMSPMYRQSIEQNFFGNNEQGDPSAWQTGFFTSLRRKALGALPSLAVGVGAGGLAAVGTRVALGSALRGAGLAPELIKSVSGAVGAGVAVGGQNMGETAGNIYRQIEQMPEKSLLKNDRYKALIDEGKSPTEARDIFKQEVAGLIPAAVGFFTGVTGPFGIEGQAVGRIAGIPASGVVKGAAKGFAGEAVQEGFEGAAGNVGTQGAMLRAGLKQSFDMGDLFNDVIEGALVGGVLGGGVGGVTNIRRRPEIVSTEGVNAAEAAALSGPQQPLLLPPPSTPGAASEQAPAPVTPPSNEDGGNAAGTNTVPERTENISAQMQGVLRGDKPLMQIPATRTTTRNGRTSWAYPGGTKSELIDAATNLGLKVIDPKGKIVKPYVDPETKERVNPGIIIVPKNSKVTANDVMKALKENRLNELLVPGSTENKQQAKDNAAAQGAAPVVVQARDANNNILTEMAASPQQAANVASLIGGENVTTTTPVAAVTERLAPEPAPAPAPAMQEVDGSAFTAPPVPPTTGRILEDQTELPETVKSEIAAAEARIAENIKDTKKQAIRDQKIIDAGGEDISEGRKAGKEEITRRQAYGFAIENAIAPFQPTEAETIPQNATRAQMVALKPAQLAALKDRLNNIVRAASKVDGLKLPTNVKRAVNRDMQWSPAVLRAVLARDFLKKKNPSSTDILEFQASEHFLLKGDIDQFYETRGSADSLFGAPVDEANTVDEKSYDPTEDTNDENEGDSAVAKTDDFEKRLAEARERPVQLVSKEAQEQIAKIKARAEKAAALAARPGTEGEGSAAAKAKTRLNEKISEEITKSAVTAGKDKTGTFKVQRRKIIKKPSNEQFQLTRDELAQLGIDEAPLAIDLPQSDTNATITLAGKSEKAIDTVSARELYKALKTSKLSDMTPATFVQMQVLRRRLLRFVGNIPVHISRADTSLRGKDGQSFDGYYSRQGNYIVVSERMLDNRDQLAQLLTHELSHAAYSKLIDTDARARKAIRELMRRTERRMQASGIDTSIKNTDDTYGLTDEHEFIAEALSKQAFQEWLLTTPLGPDAAASVNSALGAPVFRALQTFWDVITALFKRALFRNVGADNWRAIARDGGMTAFDGALRVVQRLDTQLELSSMAGTESGFATNDARELFRITTEELTSAGKQQAIDSMYRGQALGSKLKRGLINMMGLNQIADNFKDTVLGPHIEQFDSVMRKLVVRTKQLSEGGLRLTEKARQVQLSLPAQSWNEFQEIAQTARLHNISIYGDNKHLGKNGLRGTHARAQVSRIQRRMAALTAKHPELESLYKELVEHYKASHGAVVQATIRNLLKAKNVNTPDHAALAKRIYEDGLARDADLTTNPDYQLLGETLFRHLRDGDDFKRIKGDYFPLMRYGDHVIVAHDDIEFTGGGKLVGPNVVQFAGKGGKKAAQDFASHERNQEFVGITITEQWYNSATNEKMSKNEANAIGAPPSDLRYDVKIPNETVYMFEKEWQAKRAHEELKKEHSRVGKPEVRKGAGYDPTLMTPAMAAQIDNIVDHMSNVTDKQKEEIRTILKEASMYMMDGNKIKSRTLKSRNIPGANPDIVRNLTRYSEAMGKHIATAESGRGLYEAVEGMEEALKNYSGADRPELVHVAEELKRRAGMYQKDKFQPGTQNRFMRALYSSVFLARLASPMYSVINGMQPWMVTLPYLAGKYTGGKALSALNDGYRAIGLGGLLNTGAVNTWKAIKGVRSQALSLDTRDPVGDILKRVKAQKDGSELVALLRYLIDNGAIDPDAGFEVNRAMLTNASGPERLLSNVDRVARQLPAIVEAINRSVSGIATYRLAREGGMSAQQAMDEALRVTRLTQGDYNPANASRYFNNPLLQPAFQFKKYAMMMSYLIYDIGRRAGQGDKVAMKQMAYLVGVQMIASGALGLPGLELLKAAAIITSAFGFPDWEEYQEMLRRATEGVVGEGFGQMLMHGWPRAFGYGIDISYRVSLADMWLFGEPKDDGQVNRYDNIIQYIATVYGGAPLGFLKDVYDGQLAVRDGDYAKGLGKIVPFKLIGDTLKAWDKTSMTNEDKTARVNSPLEFAANVFGAQTARQAENFRKYNAGRMERADLMRESQRLRRLYRRAKTYEERVAASERNREFNAALGPKQFYMRLPTRVKSAQEL